MEWLNTALIGVLIVIALVAAWLLNFLGAAVLTLATLGLLVSAPMDTVSAATVHVSAAFYTAGAVVRAL